MEPECPTMTNVIGPVPTFSLRKPLPTPVPSSPFLYPTRVSVGRVKVQGGETCFNLVDTRHGCKPKWSSSLYDTVESGPRRGPNLTLVTSR